MNVNLVINTVQEVTQRILEAIGGIAGSSLEQTSWLSRSLEVKVQPQVCPEAEEPEEPEDTDVDGENGGEFYSKPARIKVKATAHRDEILNIPNPKIPFSAAVRGKKQGTLRFLLHSYVHICFLYISFRFGPDKHHGFLLSSLSLQRTSPCSSGRGKSQEQYETDCGLVCFVCLTSCFPMQMLAPLLDMVYRSDEKEKAVPLISRLLYYVFPYLKNHR